MATKITGGATSAVAASSHASCSRFRGSDPLITGVTRRNLSKAAGAKEAPSKIPTLRWTRALMFERLVRDDRFASQVVTTATGKLNLVRPTGVKIVDAKIDVNLTASLLSDAHHSAIQDGVVTLIHQLAIPFLGFTNKEATNTQPDFSIVAPKVSFDYELNRDSWLILGDSKDYQRVRGKIDDERMLKGFLQVALGAESAATWSGLPANMDVHTHGILAVPLNSSLTPMAIVEDLTDHREEVRMRVAERKHEAAGYEELKSGDLVSHLAHLKASFDPSTCSTCDLFSYCRAELQKSNDPNDLLIEIGVPEQQRDSVLGSPAASQSGAIVPQSVAALVQATTTGIAVPTGRQRLDPIGEPGTINVVLAKSDGAALGTYGIRIKRLSREIPIDWQFHVFNEPDSEETRRAVMRLVGSEIREALKDMRSQNADEPDPIHIITPDGPTGDLLVSMADSIAGAEINRLRWAHDLTKNREPLNYDGTPARPSAKLSSVERFAVSFLLEEDRARAFQLRSPLVNVQAATKNLIVAGGPATSSLRVDYLFRWAFPNERPIDFRELNAEIERSIHTPGARLTSFMSDRIYSSYIGKNQDQNRPASPLEYTSLIKAELNYKASLIDQATQNLPRAFSISKMREIVRKHEANAQSVWRRRLSLHASDLVRFSRTSSLWRNGLVSALHDDDDLARKVAALTNPHAANDAASDAGTRELAVAEVAALNPILLNVHSRRIAGGSRIVLLHINGKPCAEERGIIVKSQKTNFKVEGLSIGELSQVSDDASLLLWQPHLVPNLRVGDQLVIANFGWFSDSQTTNSSLPVKRPASDTKFAPTPNCSEVSFAEDPSGHNWCCKSHEVSEAEYADLLAQKRLRGELNPQVWPPVIDTEAFDTESSQTTVPIAENQPPIDAPDGFTLDDLE